MGRLSNPPTAFGRIHVLVRLGPDVRASSASLDARPSEWAPRLPEAQTRLSAAEVSGLVGAYVRGATIADLAAKYSVCHRTVIEHLQRAGVHLRKPQRKLVDGRLTQAIEHYSAGLSLARVGQILGVDAKTVGRSLRDAGVEVRPRRGQRG